VRRTEADSGKRTDILSTQQREEIRKLRKENFELRRANEILKAASLFFPREPTSPPAGSGRTGVGYCRWPLVTTLSMRSSLRLTRCRSLVRKVVPLPSVTLPRAGRGRYAGDRSGMGRPSHSR
jgi:hypothetical protein